MSVTSGLDWIGLYWHFDLNEIKLSFFSIQHACMAFDLNEINFLLYPACMSLDLNGFLSIQHAWHLYLNKISFFSFYPACRYRFHNLLSSAHP